MPRKRDPRDFQAEIDAHLQLEADALRSDGVPAFEAQAAARRAFGNRGATEERSYESTRWMFFDHVARDLRFGLRMLARDPRFTAVAIATLALGIGVNATVFSITNGLVYKNLPFSGSDRVLYLVTRNNRVGVPFADYCFLREQVHSLPALGAAISCAGSLADDAALPQTYPCSRVTVNSFQTIGQTPIVGRDFTAKDERPGAPPVAILGYSLWERRYGHNPSVIGRSIRIDAKPVTIVGVMGKGVIFPNGAELWQPVVRDAADENGPDRYTVFGRLPDGISLSTARVEVDTIGQRLQSHSAEGRPDTITALPSNEIGPRQKFRSRMLVLLVAVGLVLLIACSNIANLLLARGLGRAREISIRMAIGAGRWRVVRQLLVESILLAVGGGTLGWLIAIWGTRLFDAAVVPTGKPAWIDFSLDYHVLAYIAVISVGGALLFGLAPALRLARSDVNSGLKDGRIAGSGGRGRKLSSVLVVSEMALAVILLSGAGLMIRSFMNAYRVPTGYDTSHILAVSLDPADSIYPKAEDQTALYRRVARELGSMPGVQAVTLTSTLPGNSVSNSRFEIEDGDAKPIQASTKWIVTGDNYFETIGVKPGLGRFFHPADRTGAPMVTVINRGFAALHFRGRDPIGRRIRLMAGTRPGPWMEVIGVAPDLQQFDFEYSPSDPVLYVPFNQQPRRAMHVLLKTGVPPASLMDASRRALQGVDRDLPAKEVVTFDDQLSLSRWPLRIFGAMLAIFAAIALLLASVGLSAVIAHTVDRRKQEIGVRVAMGASRRAILRLVLREGMRQVAIGLALGIPAAFALSRVMQSALEEIAPNDAWTFCIAALVLIVAAAAGCIVPARRALELDPVRALHCD